MIRFLESGWEQALEDCKRCRGEDDPANPPCDECPTGQTLDLFPPETVQWVNALARGLARLRLAPGLARRLYSLEEIDLMLALQRYQLEKQAKDDESPV